MARFGACVGVPVWQRMGLGVLADYVPAGLVDEVLADTGRVQRRVRRLPARVVVWFVLALTLFGGQGYRSVWRELAHSEDEAAPAPSASGLSQARRRLGVAPLAGLFARLRGPQAEPGAPGAFLCGLRLVSWDATTLDVPDSPANNEAFIGSVNARGRGAFPKVRLLALIESVQGVDLTSRFDHTGCDKSDAGPVPAGVDGRSLLKTGGGCRLLDLARLDVSGAAGLRGEQPDHAVVGERPEHVDERVDQVAVAVAPPQQHDVDDLLGLLVDQFPTTVDKDVAEILVDVVVIAHLHNDHARLDPEPVRQAAYVCLTRGRVHRSIPPWQVFGCDLGNQQQYPLTMAPQVQLGTKPARGILAWAALTSRIWMGRRWP